MSGRTKAEQDRIKSQKELEKARKKKKQTAQKKKTEGTKALGLTLPKANTSLPTLSRRDMVISLPKVTRTNKTETKKETKTENKAEKKTAQRYNPQIRTATRMTADSSPEIDNLAEAVVRKGAQGVEGALVGYSDRRNFKKAADILTGEYNNRVNPFVRTGQKMKVDDPTQVAKAEAEAKRLGYKDLEGYEKAKANELIHANDDFYQRKAVLDKRIELENYTGIKKYLPDVAEQIGSLIPTMAVGAATGGVGAAAGLTGRALWAFNTLVTGGEISGRVSGQEARTVYNALADEYRGYMNRENMVDAIQKANTAGELVGIAEAGTEAVFGGIPLLGKGLLDDAAKKAGWEVLSPATKESIKAWRATTPGRILSTFAERSGGAIGEGVEEVVMTFAQPAIEKAVAGLESEVTMQDIIRDFGMGAAVSLVLGVPVTMAETASVLSDASRAKDAKGELISAFENRAKEMVEAGMATPEEAKASVQEVKNVLSGRGSLRISDVERESKIAGDTKEVYSTVQDAKAALERQAEGKEIGEEVSVAVVENGVPETWTARVAEKGIEQMQLGSATAEEQQAYIDKAKRMETAANEAERSGYQLNVKDEIVKEVSGLSKALGREVEFIYDSNTAMHGYLQGDKIFVNANSSQSPARAVIAHEMTHMLEDTMSYSSLRDLVYRFYGDTIADRRQEILDDYAASNVTLSEEKNAQGYDEVDTELMAHFVEDKLLTDKAVMRQVVKEDRSLAQRIIDWINRVIQKIGGTKEQRMLLEARELWRSALAENKKAPVDGAEMRYSFKGYAKDGRGMYEGNFKVGTPKSDKAITIKDLVQNIWHKEPIPLVVKDKNDSPKVIWAKFDPYYDEDGHDQSDLTKLMGGNRHGTASDQRVTLNLAHDYPQILSEARYNGQKKEVGKSSSPHQNVDEWFYFINDIYYAEKGSDTFEPYRVSVNVKHIKDDADGYWVYSFSAEKEKGSNAPQTLHAVVKDEEEFFIPNAGSSNKSIADSSENGKQTFSIGKRDEEYIDAINRGDMETVEKMVEEEARSKGYDSPKLYHGTEQFGFTRLRTQDIEDAYAWSPFFATDSEDVAETYSGETDRRQIKDRLPYDFKNLSEEDVLQYARENIDPSVRIATPQDVEKLRKPLVAEVEKWISQLEAEYANKNVDSDKLALMDGAKKSLLKMVNAQTEEDAENARSEFYYFTFRILKTRNDVIFEDNLYFNYPPVKFAEVQELFDKNLLVFDVGDRVKSMRINNIRGQIRDQGGRGIYALYANTSNVYEIDADGAEWSDISGRFIEKDGLTDTRGVALYARSQGYSGVIIRNLVDVGGQTEYKAPSDIYIFFEPHFQVKSADPVTYDDDGNIIPLSERFTNENDDIRFSIGKADIEDKELRDLIKAENRKMRDVFYSRSVPDREVLWDMIEDEEKHIAATGSYRHNVVQDIIDFAYETGYRYINEENEPVNSLGKVSISVPERYRGEMDTLGGLAEVNRQMFGSGILFTYKPNKHALDDAYATLQAENQGIMAETMDPSEQVQNILDAFGRGARNSLRELDSDEYNPFAEQENPYRRAIESTVQDAVDSIQALAVKKISTRSRQEGRQDVNRWVAKAIDKEARNYTVGSDVEWNGERGTVTERITKGRSVKYTITLDTGEVRENVTPDELRVGVTPDLYFDELPEDQREVWQDPPENWNISRDLADVAPLPIDMKEYREILYENGITVGVRKLNEWFKREGWLKRVDRVYYPTQKALDAGYFKREKYGNRITEEGQKHFLDLFLGDKDLFADPDETNNLVLPGNKQAKDSPLEDSEVLNMVAEHESELTETGEDYTWAQALTGKGVTYSKDYARNFDAAAKFNPHARQNLQRLFVRPLEKAKADYAKAVRSKLTEMHEEMKKLGIKKDTEEASAVQWIGEGFYQDKYGETHEYTIEMLREEFPDTWENIEKAAQYFRRIYDDYLAEINAARELIYPHPLEDAQDQIAAYEVRRHRAEDKINELRATISELETVVSAKKAEYANAGSAELQKAIRYNEDRLTKAKISLGDYISRRSKYAEKIKQIQADIDSGDILRNKRIVPRKDYFHHFQEMTDGLGDVFRLSRNSAEIDPRLEGTSGYTQPKSKFSGITLHRNHGRYKADAIGGMIDYAQAGEYMIHIDPVISQFRSHIMGMANATKDSRNANKLIRWLVQWTNDLAGKTNPADRWFQDVIGREAVQFARKINSRAKANAVVGNLNSATAQIFNLPNLVGHVKDPKAYTEGLADLFKFIAREKTTRDLVKESGFLNERYLDDVINAFDEKKLQIPGKVAQWTLTVGDRYSTALIWFVAHHEAVNKGIVDPIEYADNITRRCVAGRGIGEIPITQRSNITQIFAPFQIEVNNAWQLYKEKLAGIKTANTKKEKATSFAQFLAILIANFMFNTVTDLLIHRRVTFDPIYVLFQCISDWMNEDEDEEKNWAEKFTELLGRESGEIISNMPYGSLIAYYAFNNQWAREKIFGDQDPTRFGVGNVSLEWVVGFVNSLATGEDIVDDALGFLTTFVMPFGGKQAERSLQALVDTGVLPQVKWGWKEGLTLARVGAPGSYSKNGEFQFPLHTVKTDFGQWVTNVIFGKYATDEGQKYLGKDYENSTFWQNVFGFNKTKERTALKERATKVLTDLVKAGADVFEVYDTIRDIQDADDVYAKRNILLQAELSAEEKTSILLGYLTQKNNVESTTEKLNGIIGAGLTVDDYLSLVNTRSIIDNDESYESAQDKAWAFNNAMIADGYTTAQIQAINKVLKFYSHIPADTSKFDKLANLGLDAETTMKVTEALGALEPLPGEKSIKTWQKAEAIANLGLTAEQELAAMSAAMDKKQYAKYESMAEYGVTAQTWVDFEKALAEADAANADEAKRNGSYDKDEKAAALASMDVSNAVKAVLWQSKDNQLGSKNKTTSWKAARNPYDSGTAAKMIDSYMEKLEAIETADSYASPLGIDIASNITSEFGMRVHPVSGQYKQHDGVDIKANQGEPVLSAADGEVVKVAKSSTGYGNHVIVEHADGTQTLYAHLYSYGVKEGDVVTQGQQIGEVGSTGTSTGNHLHFEVRKDGVAVDPQTVFDLTGEGIRADGEYTPIVSGGGSSGGGGSTKKSSPTPSGSNRVATVSTNRSSNSGGSYNTGNSGGAKSIQLPAVSSATPPAGRSTKNASYGAKGLTLPKANSTPQRNISSSVATTQRTGRTGGSLWDPDILG